MNDLLNARRVSGSEGSATGAARDEHRSASAEMRGDSSNASIQNAPTIWGHLEVLVDLRSRVLGTELPFQIKIILLQAFNVSETKLLHDEDYPSQNKGVVLEGGRSGQIVESTQNSIRSQLRRALAHDFNEDELRTLCFDLKVDYESFSGQGKGGKAREIVAYFERTEDIHLLVEKCWQLRPNGRWKEFAAFIERTQTLVS
jgi:hypothetical protein